MFCNHKYGEVKEGYQYCLKCGRAILAPCNHVWEIIEGKEVVSRFNSLTGFFYVNRCKKCGVIDSNKITI